MITFNVYHRVFQLKFGRFTGTCFTLDIEGRQYIITARHLLDAAQFAREIQIFHANQWKNLGLSLIGRCEGEVDIAVLSAPIRLSPALNLPATADGIALGQDVYFLGFPYGWSTDLGEVTRNFPTPFVKKAILSNAVVQNGLHQLLLDGHNNVGFSGGPVVFKESNKNEYKVASVIAGYRTIDEPIFDQAGQIQSSYNYNTGIVISYGIQHAIALIENNPNGLQVNA